MQYSRQEVLKHIGKEGQAKLSNSSVVIVGVGSTGTVAAELLARSGVNLTVIDHDVVEESNLNRQTLYSSGDVGKPKAEVASASLKVINPNINVIGKQIHLAYDTIDVLKADLILDCTDNMETRLLINDYALKNNIPWIYAAAIETRGMVFVSLGKPCFNCIFSQAEALENCESAGIMNTASTQVASIQATEALKILLGERPCSDLIHVDVWKNKYQRLKVEENPKCKACNGEYEHLKPAKNIYKIEFCKSKAAMSAKPQKNLKLNMKKVVENFDVVADANIVAVINIEGEEIVVHDYGELLFKKEKNEDRLKELAEKVYEVAL